jgi:pimeloyl-ACP methyl ester carboxylesterase
MCSLPTLLLILQRSKTTWRRTVVVALSVLGACRPDPTRDAVAAVDATACPFELTDLDASRIRCGYLSVPERHDWPAGNHIRIAFAIMAPSQRDADTSTPYIFLAGGPGATGMSSPFLQHFAPLLATDRPVVAFDQRGTGYAEPALCPGRIREDARISALDLSGEALRARRREADIACRDSLVTAGVDLLAYNSTAIADDVELLRKALGFKAWIPIGASYGGALAQRLMWRHSHSVRAAVLLSPSRFEADIAWIGIFRAVAANLRSLSGSCVEIDTCPDSLQDLDRQFAQIAASLRRGTFAVPVDSSAFGASRFYVNTSDFADLIAAMTMSPDELPYVPSVLRAFEERDSVFVAAAISRFLTPSDPHEDSGGMGLLVRCADLASPATRARWAATLAESPIEGELDFYLDACDELPQSDQPAYPPISTTPVLILSGRFDDRSPPSYSASILEDFPNGRQVIFANAAHDVVRRETAACVLQLISDFLADSRGALDDECATAAPALYPLSARPDWAPLAG